MPKPQAIIELRSWAPIAPEALWQHATSLAGINDELAPLMRLATPPDCSDLATFVTRSESGQPPACTIWFLGLLPQPDWRPVLAAIGQGHFVERSQMWGLKSWQHERTVRAQDGGSVLADRITIEPLAAWQLGLVKRIVLELFRHRHRRLAARFGARPL